jgi:hypothetical protein
MFHVKQLWKEWQGIEYTNWYNQWANAIFDGWNGHHNYIIIYNGNSLI